MIKLKIIFIVFVNIISFNLYSHYTNQAYVCNNKAEPYYLKKNYIKHQDGYKGPIKGLKKSSGWGWRNWHSYYNPRYSATYNYPWYIEGYYYPWWYYGYLPYYYWWY